MPFESIPKPEKTGGERIKFIGEDGVERSLTPEEFAEHVKAEEKRSQLKENKESSLLQTIEVFKKKMGPKEQPPEEKEAA